MKVKAICTLIGVLLLTLTCAMPSFGGMDSTSFRVPAQVLNGGGAKSTSGNFSLVGSIGQSTAIGFSEAPGSFRQKAGFIPQTMLRGNLNGDATVDIFDYMMCLDIILNDKPYVGSADLNGDGVIDVCDLMPVLGMILECED